MNADTIFSAVTVSAAVAWLAMIVAPRWKYTEELCGGVPAVFAVVYSLLIIFYATPFEGGLGGLSDLQRLFQNPYVLLAGWVHYLAFDLWVGTWILKDSQANNLPHWIVVPVLVMTFLFGPMGYGFYLVVKHVRFPAKGIRRRI